MDNRPFGVWSLNCNPVRATKVESAAQIRQVSVAGGVTQPARASTNQSPLVILPQMFVEVVEGPLSDWNLVREKSRLLDDPPDGLLACVVTPVGDEAIHGVMVWETPGQRGDWAAAVMMPLFESGALAGVTSNPAPTTPVDLFLRPVSDHA